MTHSTALRGISCNRVTKPFTPYCSASVHSSPIQFGKQVSVLAQPYRTSTGLHRQSAWITTQTDSACKLVTRCSQITSREWAEVGNTSHIKGIKLRIIELASSQGLSTAVHEAHGSTLHTAVYKQGQHMRTIRPQYAADAYETGGVLSLQALRATRGMLAVRTS